MNLFRTLFVCLLNSSLHLSFSVITSFCSWIIVELPRILSIYYIISAYIYISLYLVVAILDARSWIWLYNFRFVISDSTTLRIPSYTRKLPSGSKFGSERVNSAINYVFARLFLDMTTSINFSQGDTSFFQISQLNSYTKEITFNSEQ